MTSFFSPSQILYQDTRAQLLTLMDGRLLLRHKGGFSFLNGLREGDVRELLNLVDGNRTLAEICEAAPFQSRDVENTLCSLANILVFSDPPQSPDFTPSAIHAQAKGLPVLVAGNGLWSQKIAESLGLEHVAFGHLQSVINNKKILIAVLEEAPLKVFLEIQDICFESDVALLPVYTDPFTLRIGPLAAPGFACVLCSFYFLFSGSQAIKAEDMLRLLTGPAPVDWSVGLQELARTIQSFSRPTGSPVLLNQTLSFPGSVNQPVPLKKQCSACRSPENSVLAQSLQWHRITAFESKDRKNAWRGPRSIGILGGGTAGYLTAIALKSGYPELTVELLESDRVPVIGVGEATTPLMPQFLHNDLGLDIHDMLREVDPTLKLGIKFQWGPGRHSFNYPFGPVRILEAQSFDGHLDYGSLSSMAMNRNKAPLTIEGENRLGVNTAYHLDNRKFVEWLQKKARERGVIRHVCHVDRVIRGEQGVKALVDMDGKHWSFDLYIDCSGFRSKLLEKSLGSPFVSYGAGLFTDKAVIASVPHHQEIKPYTLARAMKAGWCWNTPQREADHRGYVFSSAFLDDQGAIDEMKAGNPGMSEPKIIRFKAGRHKHFWKENVVAMGNAYGFVEPLESTALHMLIKQIGLLLQTVPQNPRGLQPMVNKKVNSWWDYIYWFLTLHYKFNQKMQEPFWEACRQEIDVSSHQELLHAFKENGPLSSVSGIDNLFSYPDPLWGPEGIDILLFGQDQTAPLPQPEISPQRWRDRVKTFARFLDSCQDHGQILETFRRRPEQAEIFSNRFKVVGPAFPLRQYDFF